MTHLTPEERVLGRENANRALGVSRRDLLKAAAAAPALGAFYFGYKDMKGKSAVKAAIIGTGDEGCQAMIRSHNRDYLDFIGFCDIRPSQQERAVKEFSNHKDYSAADVKKLKQYATKEEMYADPDVEMIVIALPLWLHAPVAIEAMKEGKHVFTEKLMGALGRRVQGDVPGRPQDQPAAGRRPPAALFGPVRQRQLPGPERRPGRHPPHPGPLAPQQRPALGRQGQERQPDLSTPRPGCPSTSTTRRESRLSR